jgi:hypothetical protein
VTVGLVTGVLPISPYLAEIASLIGSLAFQCVTVFGVIDLFRLLRHCTVIFLNSITFLQLFTGDTAIDDKYELAKVSDESDGASATEKKSKLTIPANYAALNDELKCVATWTGTNAKAIETKSDINAIGASMGANTFTDGATGDGIINCVVWGDSKPFSVTWKNEKEEVIQNKDNEVILMFLSHRVSPFIIRKFYLT